MTIPEIAAAFNKTLVAGSEPPAGAPLAIMCNNHKPRPCFHQFCESYSHPGKVSDDDSKNCSHLTFFIDLSKHAVLVMGVTADTLTDRTVPSNKAPDSGDCMLTSVNSVQAVFLKPIEG